MANNSEELPPPSAAGTQYAQYELQLGKGRGRRAKKLSVASELIADVAAEVVDHEFAPPPPPPAMQASVESIEGRVTPRVRRAHAPATAAVVGHPPLPTSMDESSVALLEQPPANGGYAAPAYGLGGESRPAARARRDGTTIDTLGTALSDRTKAKKPWWQYELTASRIKPVELMNFSRQASSFIRAGIPIIDAFDTIAYDVKDKLFKSILNDTADRLRSGVSLGDALMAHGDAFPGYYISMVRAAELTGRLDEVLDQLADYMQRDLDTRRQIKSALTYPSVVLLTGIATVVTLTVYVLPKFKSFFKELNAKLPLTTRMLLGFSDFLSAWGLVMFGGFVAIAVGLFLWLRTEGGKASRDAFYLRIPVVGNLVQFVSVERFCRGLSALVSAGVPLPEAMQVASATTGNRKFISRLATVRERLIKGEGLAQPIADTQLFPAAASQMMRVGEATGTLDAQLDSASEFYRREVSYRLKKFTDMFEPLMIIAMGVMVGFVALALVQAMYGVFGQVQ